MLSFWQSEDVFFNGDAYFDELVRDIDGALEYITVEMYMFNDDTVGKRIALHLIKAQARGVKVQIIVDGVGSYLFFDKLYGLFQRKQIPVKIYNPLPIFHPYYGQLPLKKKWQIFLVRLNRVNKRNHRKIITIDSRIMYAGSFNFAAEHTRFHREKAWKDMGVRVTGENVKLAILQFKKTWKLREYYRYKKQLRHLSTPHWRVSPLRMNPTLFIRRAYQKDFNKRINQAQQKVWLTTPYFIPNRSLIKALGQAAKRGVDVQLLISHRSDVPMFRTLQYFYFPYLIKKGVKVFQYTDTILHAKNYIIDHWTTIGSSNLNHRSFLHDLEVDLVIQKQENLALVEKEFLNSTRELRMITEEGLKNRPILDRFLSRLFFLFKYWF